MYSVDNITKQIKAEAERLGFSACGIAKAEPVDVVYAMKYRLWLSEGNNAGMSYLENNLDKRLDPTLLMPGAKSIICLALNYFPEKKLTDDQYKFAYYAYGKDYHDVMKAKMRELVEHTFGHGENYSTGNSTQVAESYKLCCDTVPILDRYWAQRAGLGWIGKNGNLIIPHAGSFFFLCEIIVDFELEYDSPVEGHCGSCSKCLDACPTGALSTPYMIDARKCLSYLTIEHRGEYDVALDEYIYGCDRCQLACPYNKFATPTKIEEFAPSNEFLSMRPADWQHLSVEQYKALFKGSAVKRAKYEGLVRNITHLHQE